MKILFLFLDGVGLGQDQPSDNPFAQAKTPFINDLLDGHKLLANQAPYNGKLASLLSLDACLGVPGTPQSATGQASLLTGINIPAQLGYHYGPKPNPEISSYLKNGNLFSTLKKIGKQCAFLNAYPPAYFEHINSGRRIYAAIPLAAVSAGMNLRTVQHLLEENALSADFTGAGWREQLGIQDAPLYNPLDAGVRLGRLAQKYDFSLFEYWLSDYTGHHRIMDAAINLLETLDQVLEGLCSIWNPNSGLILITSDHGNMEDLSTRKHTLNPVPAFIIGHDGLRQKFQKGVSDISHIAPAIISTINHSVKTNHHVDTA